MSPFSAIPFFRILLPFVAGILIALAMDVPPVPVFCFAAVAVVIGLALYRRLKYTLLALADLFLLLYGISLMQQQSAGNSPTFYGNIISTDSTLNIIAVVQDLPVEKEKTIKCDLKLLQIKCGAVYKPVSGSIIAYFKRPVARGTLAAGKTVLLRAKLAEAPAPMNPFEFNYKAWLQHKQVYHLAFVDAGSYAVLPSTNSLNPIWRAGLACKAFIMERLKEGGLSANAYNICCALLTGYDDEIDRTVMDAFAHSGTLHVLSVSGLHTGLIYLVLSFLFDLADRHRRYKLLKFCLVTFVLWGFALITGFSAPVLRAVIMFNLFGLGSIYFRNDARNQVNILLVSAFILLCYNPFFIADVGFLLSYFALAGLICFQPKLSAAWQPGNRFTNYVWQSITASVAATLSTLPLTLFYFKQFPFWFFVCNLVVVPATFVILFLAVLVVFRLKIAALIINWLTAGLIGFINAFNSNRFGFADGIHFLLSDVLCLSLTIVLASAALYYRSYRLVVASLLILIAWQSVSLLSSFENKRQQLFSAYQLKNTSLLSVKNKNCVYLSAIDSADYNFHIKPHLTSFNYPEVAIKKFNYVRTATQSVLILNTDNAWPAVANSDVTTLVLANDFKITAADLQRFTRLRTLVADGSNNNASIKKAEELSRNFGLDFYNTKRKGAYLLALE